MLFNDLYNKMKRPWKCGENDEVILKKALKVYHQQNKKAFKFIEFQNIVKDNKKWKMNKTSDKHIDSDLQRSRTSESNHTTSDVHVGFDLNDDELIQVTPPSRQWGRDKAKHKDKGKVVYSDDSKEMGTT